MNYPKKQFNVLLETLRNLDTYFEFTKMEMNLGLLHELHWRVYVENNTGGVLHNSFYIHNGKIIKKSMVDENPELYAGAIKLTIPPKEEFLLYPDKCHDDHIITATKKAVKILKS